MKRITFILPCLALTAFAGYYQHGRHPEIECAVRKTAYTRDDFIDPYHNRDGRKDAEADLARGKLRIVGYGLPVHWIREYREVMKRDYNVDDEAIAGCVVTDGLLRYVAEYNKVMEARIIARYGEGVFDEGRAKAQALYAERHRAARAED